MVTHDPKAAQHAKRTLHLEKGLLVEGAYGVGNGGQRMKFAKLIRRNLFRNKLRAILTMLLMAVIFFFVATLLSILDNFDSFSERRRRRQPPGRAVGHLAGQPAAVRARAENPADARRRRHLPSCSGSARTTRTRRTSSPTSPSTSTSGHRLRRLQDRSASSCADFLADRRGALVGTELMKRFGWKVGDRITLKRQIFPFDPELTIRGTYVHPVQHVVALLPHGVLPGSRSAIRARSARSG